MNTRKLIINYPFSYIYKEKECQPKIKDKAYICKQSKNRKTET